MATRFVDARGTEWEVWEIGARRPLADVERPPRPRIRPRTVETVEVPYLRFDSATQRRWLTPYPPRWHAMRPEELAELCDAARPELPASLRTMLTRGPTSATMRG